MCLCEADQATGVNVPLSDSWRCLRWGREARAAGRDETKSSSIERGMKCFLPLLTEMLSGIFQCKFHSDADANTDTDRHRHRLPLTYIHIFHSFFLMDPEELFNPRESSEEICYFCPVCLQHEVTLIGSTRYFFSFVNEYI